MKIMDNRVPLTIKQIKALWDKAEAIDTNYKCSYYPDELLKLDIDRRLYKHFPFNHLGRRDFKIELAKDGKRAEIFVHCRGVSHEEYDAEYLKKLGALLEQNNFEVTAYLLEDC
jgi:hypothetical protein